MIEDLQVKNTVGASVASLAWNRLEFPRSAWRLPSECQPCLRDSMQHVGVCMEKVDEHGFLFWVEVGADHEHLVVGAVGVE